MPMLSYLRLPPLLVVLALCACQSTTSSPPTGRQNAPANPNAGPNANAQARQAQAATAQPRTTRDDIVDGYGKILSPSDFSDRTDAAGKLLSSGMETTFTLDAHRVRSPQGDINFTRYQPIYMDVANVDIVEEYRSPMQEPYVEHLLPITPAEAMRIWVKDRIRTSGADRTLQVLIKDASIVSSKIIPPGGESFFKDEPNRKYDARLEVEMRVYGTNAMSDASVSIVVTQTNTINEKASINERKAIFRQMMFALTDSANAELEKQIFKYFTRYINYSQTP